MSALPPGFLASSTSSSGSGAGFVGDLGFGYRINDFVRMDATWDYWTSPSRTRSFAVICPYGLHRRREPDHRRAGGIPLRSDQHLRRHDESEPAQRRLPGERLCRSRDLRRVHALRRRRRRPQRQLPAGERQLPGDRERPRLCGQSHVQRRVPLRVGQLGRTADHSAARHSVHGAELEPNDQLDDLPSSPGRSRSASASSSLRARRSTSATVTSTPVNRICWSIRKPA